MSPSIPFPGIAAQPPHDEELQRHIEAFQAAMFRVQDSLNRVGSLPAETDLRPTGLSYIDRQLMLAQSNLDASRIAVRSIMGIIDASLPDTGEIPLTGEVNILDTPDGSGRNAGGAP